MERNRRRAPRLPRRRVKPPVRNRRPVKWLGMARRRAGWRVQKDPVAMSGKAEFHAVLEEMEPGLFRATYRGAPHDAAPEAPPALPGHEAPADTHIGTDEAGVRGFVEALARERGYAGVIWEAPARHI